MGTFPLAFWPEQTMTPKARYGAIMDDLQMIGARNMLCGMHVHVAVPDVDTRINLIMRLTPFLPLLLALSTSSPFWQGHLTGLVGYRLAAYDELPRTGLPELFRTNDDYRDFVAALVGAKIIPDASYIWWAMRPVAATTRPSSCASPTVARGSTTRSRSPRCSAAWCARSTATARSMPASTASAAPSRKENKWHAQRYGIAATFVDPFLRAPMSAQAWLDAVRRARYRRGRRQRSAARPRSRTSTAFSAQGTSADRQVDIFSEARAAGRQRLTAIKEVVDWAAAETTRAA